MFTRAKGRCECCGTHEHQAALKVDHIITKNLGGSDGISNFQALYFRCNASKRDSDSTDFRGVLQSYGHRGEGCLFCELQTSERVLLRNELAVCIADGMELHQPEWNAVGALLKQHRLELEKADGSISGFNIGLNSGESAGQTVMYAHWHQTPRRNGDTPDPLAGVRRVIPSRIRYG